MTLMERDFEALADTLTLECVAVRQETADAKSYVFKRLDGERLPFLPGQFLNFEFDLDGVCEPRCYSISSSSAHDTRFSITVKRVPGGRVSNWLFERCSPGMRVNATGPVGVFTSEPTTPRKLLFLSAGSGATPIASMMRSFADHGHDADVALLHFDRSPEDMIFRDEMRTWARLVPKSRIIAIAADPTPGSGWVGPTGMISLELLKALVPDFAARSVYACGPQGFMRAARSHCLVGGVREADFHEESFDIGSVVEAAQDPLETVSAVEFDVQFSKTGKSTKCAAGMTLLKAAQAVKVRIQTSCGKGVCGTCRVKLVSGTVEMNHGGGIRQREIDQGFVLACCSKPTSDIVVDR